MNYNRHKTLKCALLAVLAVASALQLPISVTGQQAQNPAPPQGGVGGTGGVVVGTRLPAEPVNQGKAAGEDIQFKPNNGELKIYLYSQPLPSMWLVFKNTSDKDNSPRSTPKAKAAAIKVQLPAEAKKALAAYWEVVRDHAYYQQFADKRDVQKSINMDVTLFNVHGETERRLEQVQIAAPEGKRLISHREATGLVMFAHLIAIRFMDRAKEYQDSKRKPSRAVAHH